MPLTERTDDRFGRVVTNSSLSEDDLVNIAVSERTDLNPATLKSSMEILKSIAKRRIANGDTVAFGLAYFGLEVKGAFIGDDAKWDGKIHSLSVRATPTVGLRKAIREVTVNMRGMARTGAVINTVTDAASREVNSRLTPGGGANIAGSKIKIAGDNPENGISLINRETEAETKIAPTAVLTNDPSKITFIVPADLTPGDYRLRITTQFSASSHVLKEPRVCVLNYMLGVG